eukprot:1338510-Prymnesium_polylepis.1
MRLVLHFASVPGARGFRAKRRRRHVRSSRAFVLRAAAAARARRHTLPIRVAQVRSSPRRCRRSASPSCSSRSMPRVLRPSTLAGPTCAECALTLLPLRRRRQAFRARDAARSWLAPGRRLRPRRCAPLRHPGARQGARQDGSLRRDPRGLLRPNRCARAHGARGSSARARGAARHDRTASQPYEAPVPPSLSPRRARARRQPRAPHA